MGKRRVIAETGAGQHGVATATSRPCWGWSAIVFMGETDRPGSRSTSSAWLAGSAGGPRLHRLAHPQGRGERALRDWVATGSHPLLHGLWSAPPFSTMVERTSSPSSAGNRGAAPGAHGRLLTAWWPAGGGSNSMDSSTLPPTACAWWGGGGRQGDGPGRHGSTLCPARRACCTAPAAISCRTATARCPDPFRLGGPDYPGGPRTLPPRDSGRAEYVKISDAEALEAVEALRRTEGILPALESAHAAAHAARLAARCRAEAP